MTGNTLFLAWQDQAGTRQWFPLGRLDVLQPQSRYRFCYVQGAERARQQSGFEPLVDFPDLHQRYESAELFPLFRNRVLAPGRRDFPDYLKHLDLREKADPLEILAVSGGYRATDSFEVFPKIVRGPDGAFRCRFFLHGWRHVSEAAQSRLRTLQVGEKLYVATELTNPATGLAIQIQTEDYHITGWTPRYLVDELVRAIAKAPGNYEAKVVRVNPMPCVRLRERCGR